MTNEFLIRRKIIELENHVEWMRKNLGESNSLKKRLIEISKLRAELAKNAKLTVVHSE